MSFTDIVSKFNQQADSHSKSQSLNPFSEQFEQSRSPSPRFSREEYGKPIAGSKTDLRGRKAKSHICREILELCTVIHDVGTYNAKKRDPDDDDDDGSGGEDDGTIIVSFGELFQIYTKISDKVVGLLIAAKRRGFVYFDREILFQRRDDDVLIALLKPISEISKQLKEDINQASGTTTAAPAEPKPVEKNKSSSSSKTKRVKPECNKEPKVTGDDQKNAISESAVDVVTTNGANDGPNCNEELNGVVDEEIINNVIEISENMEDDCVREIDDKTETEQFNATNTEGICNESKTEETDETNAEEINKIKTDDTNETKTDETDKTKTDEIDENKTKEVDEAHTEEIIEDETKTDETKIDEINDSNDDVIINEIESCSLANVDQKVQEQFEKDQNEKSVEVHKNYQVDIMMRENIEGISNGKEINIIIDIEK